MGDIRTVAAAAIRIRIKELAGIRKMKFPKAKHLRITVSKGRAVSKLPPYLKTLDTAASGENIIYLIRIITKGISGVLLLNACNNWKKQRTRLINLSKRNKSTQSSRRNLVLYVGSKRGRFGSRINQHIGTTNNGTYALHLRQWLPIPEAMIDVEYYQFGLPVKPSQLQFIEDSLWDHYRPVFGKRGAH